LTLTRLSDKVLGFLNWGLPKVSNEDLAVLASLYIFRKKQHFVFVLLFGAVFKVCYLLAVIIAILVSELE